VKPARQYICLLIILVFGGHQMGRADPGCHVRKLLRLRDGLAASTRAAVFPCEFVNRDADVTFTGA
jgi:hypothetical protein